MLLIVNGCVYVALVPDAIDVFDETIAFILIDLVSVIWTSVIHVCSNRIHPLD